MKLNKQTYLNKLKGCFIGKNIGGTVGGPFEGKKEMQNISGFTTSKGEPLPNDDLDLQIVWLQAVEDEGPHHINSETLGEYWISFVTPYWNEYGICKNNMQRGMMPSIAGDMESNIWKHSNGAWIRTEIWASLCPGAIDSAVKYAIEDALVDHGTGEGTSAAAFVAALESAAFFENDIEKLIDIGLSKVDPNSRIHSTIALVRKEFYAGKDYATVRNEVVELNKDIGDGWFQAPNNIAFVVIGLLYGKGDFKKSMIIAVNCGDDTDCTAATVGSILGIMYGEDNIPNDWKEYIGNKIITCSINKGVGFRFSHTIDDLVKRIAFQAPYFLYANEDNVEICDEETSISEEERKSFLNVFAKDDERDTIRQLKYSFKPNTFKVVTGALTTVVTYKDGVYAKEGETKHIEVMFVNNIKNLGNENRQAKAELILPSSLSCKNNKKEIFIQCWTPMTHMAYSDSLEFKIDVKDPIDTYDTVILKVSVEPRGKEYFVPIRFLRQ